MAQYQRTPEEMAAAFEQGFEQGLGQGPPSDVGPGDRPPQADRTPSGPGWGSTALEYGLPSAGAVGGGALGTAIAPGLGTAIGAGIGAGGGSLLASLLQGQGPQWGQAGLEGLLTTILGPLQRLGAGKSLGAFRATRPLSKEIATEQLGKRLLTPEALAAKAFYQQAGQARTPIRMGQDVLTFDRAQDMLQELRLGATALAERGRTAGAGAMRKRAEMLEHYIELSYPGFKEAQKGYHRLRSVGRAEELVERANPLEALRKDLARGRVTGAKGETVLPSSGSVTKHFNEAEVRDIEQILAKLGPEAAEGIWREMIIGHAIGATGALATGASPYAGGAIGGTAAHLGPVAINSMLAVGLRHAPTRAFIKRSLQGQGLANPHFWNALAALESRLGIMTFGPKPQEQQQE